MTVASDLISTILRDYLTAGGRPYTNRLSASILETDTTVTLARAFGEGMQNGGRLSIGLEDLEVWSADTGALTCDVERGGYGTTAVAHDANVAVHINPRYSPAQVFKAINDELLGLSGELLFRYVTDVITPSGATVGYVMDASTIDVHEVRVGVTGSTQDWPTIQGWELINGADPTMFPTGKAIILPSSHSANNPIRVTYRAGFNVLTTLEDDVETVSGAPTRILDIVGIGAAIRLIGGTSVARDSLHVQGSIRRANEVPTGAVRQSASLLREIKNARLSEERALQFVQHPIIGRHRR